MANFNLNGPTRKWRMDGSRQEEMSSCLLDATHPSFTIYEVVVTDKAHENLAIAFIPFQVSGVGAKNCVKINYIEKNHKYYDDQEEVY